MNKSEFCDRVIHDSWLNKRVEIIKVEGLLWLIPFDLVLNCTKDSGATIQINGIDQDLQKSDFRLYTNQKTEDIGGGTIPPPPGT